MEFLETDFHKRRTPRRIIQFRNRDNLSIGVDLKHYPSFGKRLATALGKGLQATNLSIRKGAYRTEVPQGLLDLIALHVEGLNDDSLREVFQDITRAAIVSARDHREDYDNALTGCFELATVALKKHLIGPLLEKIERPLCRMRGADENTIFLIEEELSEGLLRCLHDCLSEDLNLRLANREAETDTATRLASSLSLADLRSFLRTYFNDLRIRDLFSQLHELCRNKSILEKQEFYLYFCELCWDKAKYPLFYVPISLEPRADEVLLTFDSRVYLNQRALLFIRQEYNKQAEKKVGFTPEQRVFYLSEGQDKFHEWLQGIVDEIVNSFELDTSINLKEFPAQTARSLFLQLEPSFFVCLFDKSDEAIINDYEEILNLSADHQLVQDFDGLIQDFVHLNPESFESEIDEEWDQLATDHRLVFTSPIPLNKEQQNILSCLRKENCRYVVVEGPPGTGKSHTITAVVFDAILNDKSVLVLSDKKEALDVVEDKIASTMNRVRIDEDFQNPILRLGQTGSTYNKILAGSSLSRIESNVKAIKKNYGQLERDIDESVRSLRKAVTDEIRGYEGVNPEEIWQLEEIEKEISSSDVATVIDLGEAEEVADAAEKLRSVRQAALRLQQSLGTPTFSYDTSLPLSEETIQALRLLRDRIATLQRLKDSSGTDHSTPERIAAFSDHAEEAEKLCRKFEEFCAEVHKSSASFGKDQASFESIGLAAPDDLRQLLDGCKQLQEVVQRIRNVFGKRVRSLSVVQTTMTADPARLEQLVSRFPKLRRRIVGYLGRGRELAALNLEFKKAFPDFVGAKPHRFLTPLSTSVEILNYAVELRDELGTSFFDKIDYLQAVTTCVRSHPDSEQQLAAITRSTEEVLSEFLRLHDVLAQLAVEPGTILDLRKLACLAQFAKTVEQINGQIREGLLDFLIFLDTEAFNGQQRYSQFLSLNLQAITEKLDEYLGFLAELLPHLDDLKLLEQCSRQFPSTYERGGLSCHDIRSLCDNSLANSPDEHFERSLRYLSLKQKLHQDFSTIPPVEFGDEKGVIEDLVAAQMTYLMDERVVDFSRQYKGEARILRDIIRAKKRFPREQFGKLKNAFPCILSGIRDFAEFIPLESHVFDLVIIDEASQVSIAQAFPALLRAKKVLVLGDRRQFSNVKAAHARTDVNREHLANLEAVFRENIDNDVAKLEKLRKFNIRTSILEFFEFINNYRARLLKHFRGYKELISYSNEHFYDNTLQVMKIRGKPIADVLRFTVLQNDETAESIANTNSKEIEFIVSQLEQLRGEGASDTVGVITPHTNQQKLLYEKIASLPDRDYYFDTLKLKIMTFDSCQGEERDIVFFSILPRQGVERLF